MLCVKTIWPQSGGYLDTTPDQIYIVSFIRSYVYSLDSRSILTTLYYKLSFNVAEWAYYNKNAQKAYVIFINVL